MLQKIKGHYHWIIAGLVFLEMIVFGGLLNSSSVYVQPVSKGLGVSTTVFALSSIPYTAGSFVSTCLSGIVFQRFGYKRASITALLLISLGLVIESNAANIYVYGIGRGLYGIGYGGCYTAGAVWLIKNWFHKHQGAVLGAVTMSTGLGGSLMTVLLTHIIETSSWRRAQLTAACFTAGIALLYLLLKDRPEQMDLAPYGEGTHVRDRKAERAEAAGFAGVPLREQFRRPQFYLTCLCVLLGSACLLTTSTFVVPHFRSRGFDAYQAAAFQSVLMLTLAAVKLLVGFAHDRFGARTVVIVCLLCGSAGQGILTATDEPALCYAAIMLFAVGLCMTSIVIPLLTPPLFGYVGSQSVTGILLGLTSLSSVISGPVSGYSYDTTGSYIPVYRITAIVLLGILAVYLLLFAQARRQAGSEPVPRENKQ